MRRLLVVFAGLALLGAAGSVWADWEQIGPCGGNIMAMAMDPQHPSRLYAAPYGYPDTYSRIHASTNGGLSWSEVGRLGDYYVNQLIVDPHDDAMLYGLSGNNCIFRSSDAGATWYSYPLPYYGYSMTADPTTPGRLYVAGYRYDTLSYRMAVYVSVDYGENWVDCAVDTMPDVGTCCVADPVNPGVVYAGSSMGMVYRSTDGGANWVMRSNGLVSGTSISDLAAK